jgi:hypothetical protein
MNFPTIAYRSGYAYQLADDYAIGVGICPATLVLTRFLMLDPFGLLTIRAGYAWDGASGPTIDTSDSMRGSLVHDALYQLMRERLIGQEWREHADDLLRTILLEDGMLHMRAQLWHTAVRLAGGPAADPSNDHPVLFAPFCPPPQEPPCFDSR